MKNLTVYIAHFGNKNQKFLLQIIENFSRYKSFNIDLFVNYADDDLPIKQLLKKYEYSQINLFFQKHDQSIGKHLVFQHRKDIIKGLWCDASDYILYCEDDILIPEIAILTAIDFNENKFENNQICGFLRYEEKNDQKHLIDLNLAFPNIKKIHKNYFEVYNLHQGCWLLSIDQVVKSIDFFEKNFYVYREHKKYGCLEQGATGLFLQNEKGLTLFEKIYPKENLENLLIHHLPDKYVNSDIEYHQTPGCITFDSLIQKIHKN